MFRPSREHEALQWRQRLVRLVAVGLEALDRRLIDAELPVALRVRHREIGAEVEELVLDPLEPLVLELDAHPPDERVQLVDDAVSAHERVELGNARQIAERRLPGIAAARVDLRQPDRLVPLAPAHSARPVLVSKPARAWLAQVSGT